MSKYQGARVLEDQGLVRDNSALLSERLASLVVKMRWQQWGCRLRREYQTTRESTRAIIFQAMGTCRRKGIFSVD